MRASAASGVAILMAVLGAPHVAHAQASDPAAAAELFRQGRIALEAADYPLACAKLLDSLRLDVHVGTLISLAQCEEAIGKPASARLHTLQAAQLARRIGDNRASYCEERFAALDARVPRLTIRIAPGAPPGTFVRKDSVDVGPTALGVPLPIEVGTHMIVGLAPLRDTRSYTVEAAEGKSTELTVEPGDLLPDIPIAPEDLPPGDAPALTALPPKALSSAPAAPSSTLQTAAFVAGALGLAGIGFGTYFGVRAIDGEGGAPGHCNGNVCDAAGVVVRRDAITDGNASTLTFVASGALLAAGVVMYLASPRGPTSAALRLAPTTAGATFDLVGAW